MKWVIVFVILAALVGGGIYLGTQETPLPVRVGTVTRGSVSAFVEERARTSLPRLERVTMPVAGRVLPIALEPGDTVVKGQELAHLETDDLDTAVARARARVRRVEAEMRINKYDAIEQTALRESKLWIEAVGKSVEAAAAKVEASKARMDFTSWVLDKTKKLVASDTETEESLRADQLAYEEARVNYQADVLSLATWQAVQTATHLLPTYIDQWLARKRMSGESLDAQLAEAQAALAQAERDRDRAVVRSPVDGVVLSRQVDEKRMLPAGAELLVLGDLATLEVTAELLTEEATDVTPGDRVEVYGAAVGGDALAGEVRRVDPFGFEDLSSLGVQQQRVEVHIRFAAGARQTLIDRGRDLGVGFRVRVRIHTATHDNALVVPRTALFRGTEDSWHVFAIRHDRAERLTVQVGLINDDEAEITAGLEEGTRLVLAPEAGLESGTLVLAEQD